MPPPDPNPDLGFLKEYLADRDTPCPGCRYNLRGVTTGLCPECGRPITLSVKDASPLRARLPLLVLILLWLLAAGSFNAARSGIAIHQSATQLVQTGVRSQNLYLSITPGNTSAPSPFIIRSEERTPLLSQRRPDQTSRYAPMPIVRQRGSDNMPIVRPSESAPMPQVVTPERFPDPRLEQDYSYQAYNGPWDMDEDVQEDMTRALLERLTGVTDSISVQIPTNRTRVVIPTLATSGWSSVPWPRWMAFGAWLLLAIVALLCLARLTVIRRWALSNITQRLIHMTAWLAFIAYFSYHSYLFTTQFIL